MKTKQVMALAAALAAATYAAPAQAGVSFQVSVGWPPPVCVEPVYAPVCPPPVIVAPPPPPVWGGSVVVYSPYRPVCAPVRVYHGHGWVRESYHGPHGQPHCGPGSGRPGRHGR